MATLTIKLKDVTDKIIDLAKGLDYAINKKGLVINASNPKHNKKILKIMKEAEDYKLS